MAEENKITPEVMFKANERIGNSRARLLLQQPFYGVLLSMMDFIPECSIPTMATDGFKVYYNPEYTLGLTDDEVYGVMLHEVSHCIYLHCTQKRRMNRDHQRWNVATDFAVNLEIKDMGYALPGHILYDVKYREQNAEMIYDTLPEDCSKFDTMDTHIENSDENNWDDMEDRILTAYEMTKNHKGKGNMPGGLKRWIDKLRKSKVKWERIFHRYVGQAVSRDDYSYTRVNKRFLGQDIFLPDLRSHIIGSVIVGIDTSGSMGSAALTQIGSELAKMSHLISEITAITCDTQVNEVVKINQFNDFLKKLHFSGGGGTQLGPIFNHIKEKNLAPELLIVCTDGYVEANWGSDRKPAYPVLWVLFGESAPKPPWGQWIIVPNDKKDGAGW